MAPDLLTSVRRELDARLGELRPLLAEYERLTAAAEALGGINHGAARSPSVTQATPSGSPATRRRRGRHAGPGRSQRAPSGTASTTVARRTRKRAPRGAARQAILAALQHHSHTPGELVRITAMTRANVYENLQRLLREGTVAKTTRDGKSAYALASASRGN